MALTFFVRASRQDDVAAVDALLARTYPAMLKADYPPSILVTAVPIISRAQPELVSSGTYYVAEGENGQILGAGGWSARAPGNGQLSRQVGHIRHFVTDINAGRKGVGSALMRRVLLDSVAVGMSRLECLSTRTAVPFYLDRGFRVTGEVEIGLGVGILFPAVSMERGLP